MWSTGKVGHVEIERCKGNCECQVMCKGCENNERYSYSRLVREISFTFYHRTDNNVDEEVQGVHGDDANVGGGCSPIAVGPKASGR